MNIWFMFAALASFVTAILHFFLGGKLLVPPLLKAESISPVPRYTHYYCWHVVSIVLFLMSASFLYCAFNESPALAILQIVQAGLFFAWSLVLIVWKKQSPLKLIQWALFILPLTFGLLGLQ